MKNELIEFKNLQITIDELKSRYGNDLYNVEIANAERVSPNDIIKAIQGYMNNEFTKKIFLDWVNVLWFTELYEYRVENEDSISSVMTLLETLDEDNVSFSDDDYKLMIEALRKNQICNL